MPRSTIRVRIEYADQNEGFRASLPASGVLDRKMTADNDSRPWWVVALDQPLQYQLLDQPLQYQLKVAEPSEYRLVGARQLVVGSRASGHEVGGRTPAAVHILLPLTAEATKGERLRTSDFFHVAWGVCHREDAA